MVKTAKKSESKPKTVKSVSKKQVQKTDKKVKTEKPSVVASGHLVSVEYVGTLDNGEEFDNSKGHGPIQFIVGGGQVIKGFDSAVLGMKINGSKKFTIKKDEAYGDVNPKLVQVVPLNSIPEHIKSQLKAGGYLVMQSPQGQQVPAKVMKLEKESVTLDMNHPLAGKNLTFNIKVIDVNVAPEGSACACGNENCGEGGCGDACECGHDHGHEHGHTH